MNEKPIAEKKNEDIDVSDFLRLVGRGLNKVGLFFKKIAESLYGLLIGLLLFIKRKFAWILLGAIAGSAAGGYLFVKRSQSFVSTMTVRSSFDNNYFLYNQLDYFNSLVRNNRYNDLAREFNLSPQEARDVLSFSIEPVKNELEAAKLYRETFFDFRRNRFLADTAWSKMMFFKDFKKSLSDIDYPVQQITLRSKSADIYGRVQEGLYLSVNNNPGLVKRRDVELKIQAEEQKLLQESLLYLDTLRQVYSKALILEAEKPSSGSNQLVLGESTQRSPELDLFDKSLLIKDELATVQKKYADHVDLMQVYSGFNKIGTKQSRIGMFLLYTLWGALAAFVILVIIEFVRFLSRVEKNKP